MATILDELSYAKKLINNGLTRFMSGKDVRVLIKYFRHIGIEENKIYDEMISFLKEKEPNFSELVYQDMILRTIKNTKKTGLRLPEDIPITKNEFEKIKNINNYREEKVMFTILVLVKYFRITNPKKVVYNEEEDGNVNHYYLNMTLPTILKYAKTSKKKDENIFYSLTQKGLIYRYYQVEDCWYKIFFDKNDDSETVIIVTDMNDIPGFYPFYCSECGKIIDKKGRNHRMCDNCWREINKDQVRKRVENHRKKKKSQM